MGDYLDSFGFGDYVGGGIALIKFIEEGRPDHYGNSIPYTGDSMTGENRLSARMHALMCSSLPLTLYAM